MIILVFPMAKRLRFYNLVDEYIHEVDFNPRVVFIFFLYIDMLILVFPVKWRFRFSSLVDEYIHEVNCYKI